LCIASQAEFVFQVSAGLNFLDARFSFLFLAMLPFTVNKDEYKTAKKHVHTHVGGKIGRAAAFSG